MWLWVICLQLSFTGVFGTAFKDNTNWFEDAQNLLKINSKAQPNLNVAKNVIFFIGDGMGVTTVTAARIHKGQLAGAPGEEANLSWDNFEHVGLAKTYNTNLQTADSAGTATAFLCGVKSKAGTLGVTDLVERGNCSSLPLASKNISSIREWASRAGKSVGLVTTARITHATPAALYAQAVDRNWETDGAVPLGDREACPDIAKQLIANGLNMSVILGGGRQNFLDKSESDPVYRNLTGARTDGLNLIQEWQRLQGELNRRSSYVYDKAGFDAIDADEVDYLLGLFGPSHMAYELDRVETNKEPSISDMVKKAIGILRKNPNGYFLFVEGGRIDHAHHASMAYHALAETVAMDAAVSAALSLTSTEDTLVAVSADHSHVFSISGYSHRGNPILGQVNSSRPEYDLGLDEKPYTTLLYGNGFGYASPRQNITGMNVSGDSTYRYQSAVPVVDETHGGEDVAVYARGPMSHLIRGTFEQNYIPHVLAYAACMGPMNGSHCRAQSSPTVTEPCQRTGQGNTVKSATRHVIVLSAMMISILI